MIYKFSCKFFTRYNFNINTKEINKIPIYLGGPVDASRGFVLHSGEYILENSSRVDRSFVVTANSDILRDIARGGGPQHSLFAIGYAGWAAGQIEYELQENSWIIVDADKEIVFSKDHKMKWNKALSKVGETTRNGSLASLSTTSGNA